MSPSRDAQCINYCLQCVRLLGRKLGADSVEQIASILRTRLTRAVRRGAARVACASVGDVSEDPAHARTHATRHTDGQKASPNVPDLFCLMTSLWIDVSGWRVLRSVPGNTTPGQDRTPPSIMLPLDKHEAVPARPADLSNENWRQHIARQLGLQNVH